ncbi:MAG: DUF3786 domain-containing protein, partial [Planctomycetota bacterium]
MPNPYETSYKLACDRLAQMNLDDIAFNSSARIEGETLSLELMGDVFTIKERGKDITVSSGREVRISEKILLLHYLVTADGAPLSREEVTLETIPGAAFYYPTYKARSINLIIRKFASAPDGFIRAAEKIGFNLSRDGRQYRLKALVLPNVPISFILWESEMGQPAIETLKVLYDTSITHYLPLEDIIIITEMIAH